MSRLLATIGRRTRCACSRSTHWRLIAGLAACAIVMTAATRSLGSEESGEMVVSPTGETAPPSGVQWDAGRLTLGAVRFFDSHGKPTELGVMTVSPQGAYVAIAPRYESSSDTLGIALIRLADANLVHRTRHWSYYALGFSNDENQLLALGSYYDFRFRTHDFAGEKLTRDVSSTVFAPEETLGFRAARSNGKLQVTSVSRGGEADRSGIISVGDEIMAYKEGAKRTVVFKKSVFGDKLVAVEDPESVENDNSGGWASLTGQAWEEVSAKLDRPPGTFVQLRLLSSPTSVPKEVTLRRVRPSAAAQLGPHNGQVLIGQRGSTFYLRQLPLGKVIQGVTVRNIDNPRSPCVSRDMTTLACVGTIRDHGVLAVEMHDLHTSALLATLPLEMVVCKGLMFSGDSQRLYVASRDTVQVFDLVSKKWLDSIALVPPEMKDSGQIVNRHVPLGLGGPGDLYTTIQKRVFSTPAPLHTFAVSSNGIVAIGSETGHLTLYELKSGNKIAELPMPTDRGIIEGIDFSPTGDRLIAFSNGTLHVFSVPIATGE